MEYLTKKGTVKALRDVTFKLDSGTALGIVGESGCGKSTLAFSIIRCIQPPGFITSGSIFFDGVDLLQLSENKMRKMRGKNISLIPQDPMTSLNPVMRVGEHFMEMIGNHEPHLDKAERKKRALDILEKLGIPSERFKDYPHQFSGGMRQRVMIGLALLLNPKLVIADEPTTSLDALVEAQILELIQKLTKELSLTLILITHNIGVVAEICNRVIVMYA
ncbi:MAG: ABC transporter ATP-binding protein, partial [Nitrososphaerota archaeon]